MFTKGRELLHRQDGRLAFAGMSPGGDRGRLDWPDVAKGICIISVILGHLGIDFINRIVFMYHLPVFFLLAGYFLKKRPDGEFVASKAKRLLIPYFVTCVAICLIGVLRTGGSKKDAFVSWIYASLYGAGDSWDWPFHIKAIGAIWFLWALFWALIIVNHFADKKFYRIIIFCIAFTGWASFDRTQIWLPLSIQAGMLAALYVLIGYEIRKNNLLEHLNGWEQLGCFLVYAWSIWSFKGFWIVHDYMGNGWIDFIASICAAIVIISLSRYICDRSLIFRRILGWFGRNSLIILCFHIIELNVLPIAAFIGNRASAYPSLNPNTTILVIIVAKLIYVVCAATAFEFVCKVVKRDGLAAGRKES